MFSGKKRSFGEWLGLDSWRKPRRSPLFGGYNFKPRIGMRIWLTVLFMLVTAFAALTAYSIVRPILEETFREAGEASFRQVGEQFSREVQKNPNLSEQRIKSFASINNLQWGIVDGETGNQQSGDLDQWDDSIVKRAVRPPAGPLRSTEPITTGPRAGQRQATYAYPIEVTVNGKEETRAVVFVKYFRESDIENVEATLGKIEWIALVAGALALLMSAFCGYVAAELISRRLNRLGFAAERLAAGNFDERINSNVEDEVGSLGETFNLMAASLKDAFSQVEQEKERGRAILDGMTDAVVGVDRELNAIFLNPRAREMLESSDREFHNHLQEVLAKTRYAGPITEPRAASGDRIIEIRAAPLEEGALAILRDVTEESRVERTKAEFIANASHELKTPLFALSGNLEMLEDEEDEENREMFMEDMRAATERLQSLAKTLLDLSRLDANAVTFTSQEVDLEEILHEIRRDFGFTGRPINLQAEEDVPLIETDPNQLHRAITILVDNAIKYSNPDSPVDIDLHRENGHAVVSVSDEGCGIPAAEQPHIFDRFYRAQGSSRADGTGLGLALADEITHHLGGRIQVNSQPNAGSTFSVFLPIEERKA
jgi:signal transduction histidine kinase